MRYLTILLGLLVLPSCSTQEDIVPPAPVLQEPVQDELFSPKLKTTFTEDIDASLAETTSRQQQVASFSDRLQEAMGLSDEDIEKAESQDLSWDVGGYKIAARHFCYFEGCNGWVTLLYARPAGAGEPGWSNRTFVHPGPGWFFIPKGTATIIVPDREEQERILKAVEEHLK
jgi:hypothetical protein